MIKAVLVFIINIGLSFTAVAQELRLPAEWEKQEKVMLTWFGHERRDSVSCRVIEALQPHVALSINFSSEKQKAAAITYIGNFKIDIEKIEFIIDEYIDFFTRDYIFFVKDQNEKLKVVCFDYSVYGMFPILTWIPIPLKEKKFGKWDERVAKNLNLSSIKSEYVFEGGGIEANGSGTFIVIRDMALQRNPKKTLVEIENELQRTLGAKKIIWLEKGLIEDKTFHKSGPFHANYFGGGANMHIDELCRFIDDTTVIFPYISEADKNKNPVDSINYPMLETNLKILQLATTAQGKRLNIIRVPVPEVDQLKFTLTLGESDYKRFKDFGLNKGDTIYRVPATSYCNFFVSNNVVLIPKYWKPGMSDSQRIKDEEVNKIFTQLFPDRKVIQIYTLTINRGGGGIHCMTHELPSSKK